MWSRGWWAHSDARAPSSVPSGIIGLYVRREAVLSSQIEGTQSSLDDVLAYELDATATRLPRDVEEVFNHVAAMTYGARR